MFLKLLRRIPRTFRFRLTVSFSLGFIALSILLFGFAYFLVSSSLQTNDHIAIELKLKEYSNEHRLGSITNLKRKIEADFDSGGLKLFMVRLADAQNKTLLLRQPAVDVNYDYRRLEQTVPRNGDWMHLKANGEDDVLEIATLRLPDSNLIQVGKGPEQREELLDHFRNNFLMILSAAILLSVAAGALLSRQALRPIQSLTSVLGPIIDTGKVKARIPVRRSGDEFEELAIRFNQALQRIDILVEGIQASMDNVAHDLRTPMTRLRAMAESALQSDSSPEVYREALSDCLEESEQALRMLNMLMDISEVETGSVRLNITEVDLLGLVSQVTELYRGVAEDRHISLLAACSAPLTVKGDRVRLLQMLANLVDNAIKYTASGGTVQIKVGADNTSVSLMICDSGVGIPDEDLNKIWDRSFRGDKSRNQHGLGLGLSLVRAVVLAHRGSIEVASSQGHGTQFLIHFPLYPNSHDNLSKV
jgi:signal transduction histidine kinase